MAEIQVQSDFVVNGAVVLTKNYTDFPENPRIGTLAIKDQVLYAYIRISGLETWFPFSSKTHSYIHSQGGARSTWTVVHNLNTTNLFIQILDLSGNIINAARQTIDNNSFRLLFTEAVAGTVLVVAPDSIDVPFVKTSLIEVGPNVTIDTTGLKINGSYALTSASIASDIAAAVNSNVSYSNVTNKPNVYTTTEVDNLLSGLSTQAGNVQDEIDTINLTLANLADVATSGLFDDLLSKPNTLAGYGITDAYTMAQANVNLGLKANTANTLSGYGITDAYTMTQANVALGLKANTSSLATVATSGLFADLTSKPNTLAGYGITDAYTMAQANVALGLKANTASLATVATSGSYTDLTNKPTIPTAVSALTNDSGYQTAANVTAAISAVVGAAPAALDTLYEIANALGNDANLSTTLTTLIAGKANTSSLATVATSGLFADLSSKPTTLSGYGITDAYTMAQANVNLGLKANTATTLSGYGITDAYTMAQANVNLGLKANTATTLAGYGIADAYTMAQANAQIALKANVATETTVNAATDLANASTLVRRDSNASFSGNVITAINFNTTSDARFKTDIVTIDGALEMVEQMRGVTFSWIDTGIPTVGLIAQEVEQVLPELVTTDDEGYKSVAYSNLVGVLIEAIKDQQQQIDELREMVLNLGK